MGSRSLSTKAGCGERKGCTGKESAAADRGHHTASVIGTRVSGFGFLRRRRRKIYPRPIGQERVRLARFISRTHRVPRVSNLKGQIGLADTRQIRVTHDSLAIPRPRPYSTATSTGRSQRRESLLHERGNMGGEPRHGLARLGRAASGSNCSVREERALFGSCKDLDHVRTRGKAKASPLVPAISSPYFVDGAGVSMRGSISARVAALYANHASIIAPCIASPFCTRSYRSMLE